MAKGIENIIINLSKQLGTIKLNTENILTGYSTGGKSFKLPGEYKSITGLEPLINKLLELNICDRRSEIPTILRGKSTINNTDLINVLTEINNKLSSYNQLSMKLISSIRMLETVQVTQKSLGIVLNVIDKILENIPIPNITTTTAVTQRLSAALQRIKRLIEDVLKRQSEIGTLLDEVYKVSTDVSDSINNVIDKLGDVIFRLELCNSLVDSTAITSLKYNKNLAVNVSTKLNDFTKYYKDALRDSQKRVYGGYTLQIVEEEVVERSVRNKRRRAIALDNKGIVVAQTELTFATDTDILFQELILKLKTSDIQTDTTYSLDNNISADAVTTVESAVYSSLGLEGELELIETAAEVQKDISTFIDGIKKGGKKFKRSVKSKLAKYNSQSKTEIESKVQATSLNDMKYQNRTVSEQTMNSNISPDSLTNAERAKWEAVLQTGSQEQKIKAMEVLSKDNASKNT